jgi:hypothetical protein
MSCQSPLLTSLLVGKVGNTIEYRLIVLSSISSDDKKKPKSTGVLKNNLCTLACRVYCLMGKKVTAANVGCLVNGKLQNCFPYTQVLKP